MLQENWTTGLLFLLGLFWANWIYAVAALVAILFGNLWAWMAKYDPQEIAQGIYGFSPALVGIVLVFFFPPTASLWVLIAFGAILSAFLQNLFIKIKIPGFTFPFVLVAWGSIYLLHQVYDYDYLFRPGGYLFENLQNLYVQGIRGYGEVMFQSGLIPGILFLIGVLIARPAAAFYGFVASVMGAILGVAVGFDQADAVAGLFGFNALLSAIALTGSKWKDGLWVLISIIITLIIHFFLLKTELLTSVGGVLTFPFVLGTWLTLVLKNAVSKLTLAKL